MLRYREEMGGFSHSEPEAFYPTLVVPESGCFAVTDTAVDTSGNACTGPVPDKPRGATSILVPWSFRGFPHPAPLGLARGSCDKVARLLGSLGYKDMEKWAVSSVRRASAQAHHHQTQKNQMSQFTGSTTGSLRHANSERHCRQAKGQGGLRAGCLRLW